MCKCLILCFASVSWLDYNKERFGILDVQCRALYKIISANDVYKYSVLYSNKHVLCFETMRKRQMHVTWKWSQGGSTYFSVVNIECHNENGCLL